MAAPSPIPPPQRAPESPMDATAQSWRLTAWIAGVFALLTGFALLTSQFQNSARGPLDAPQLKQLKAELRQQPADEQKKQAIRNVDLAIRERHFRHLARVRSGAWLLAGSASVFLLCCYQLARLEQRRPRPQPRSGTAQERVTRAADRARWSVAIAGGATAVLLFALSLFPGVPWPAQKQAAPGAAPGSDSAGPTDDTAPLAELVQNWPCFRGANGNGASAFTNLPTQWDVKTGAGVAWKVPVPADGFSSPITWGDRIFLSGGDTNRHEVLCFDGQSGELLWRQAVTNVPGSAGTPANTPLSSGEAAATMATDGRRVYAIFANGDLAAFTLEGRPAWSKSFGLLKNPYGHAASLITWQGKLLVQLDQGEAEEGKSRLDALDGRNGKILWQQPRKVPASWASPIVFEAGGKAQVVALGLPWAISYAAADGTELWRVDCLNGEVLPSPTFAGGLLLVASPAEKLLAVRPDGQGDITKTGGAWTNEDNVPDITSPASNGELIFAVNSAGMLSAFDLRNGTKLWEHDFEMEFHASPGLAAGRLYLFSLKGTALIVAAERQFHELFRTELDEPIHASPAFMRDGLVVRGATNLWKFKSAAQTAPTR